VRRDCFLSIKKFVHAYLIRMKIGPNFFFRLLPEQNRMMPIIVVVGERNMISFQNDKENQTLTIFKCKKETFYIT
jgi:hypothetical protein